MPHHMVICEDKTMTKMRIVFNAFSSKANFLHINNRLSPDPNLMPDILILLLQFCLNKFAITEDIEDGILQVALATEERARFL